MDVLKNESLEFDFVVNAAKNDIITIMELGKNIDKYLQIFINFNVFIITLMCFFKFNEQFRKSVFSLIELHESIKIDLSW